MRLFGAVLPTGYGIGVPAVDQQRDQHAAAALGQPPRELRLRGNAGHKSQQHLRRLVRIGNCQAIADCRPADGDREQALTGDALEHRPADGEDFITVATADERWLRSGRHEFQRLALLSCVLSADDLP